MVEHVFYENAQSNIAKDLETGQIAEYKIEKGLLSLKNVELII